jgi:hypothetical protein
MPPHVDPSTHKLASKERTYHHRKSYQLPAEPREDSKRYHERDRRVDRQNPLYGKLPDTSPPVPERQVEEENNERYDPDAHVRDREW